MVRVTVLTRAIAPLHPPGGLERAVLEQVRHLAGLGVAVTVLTRPPVGSASTAGSESCARWRFVPYRSVPLRPGSVVDRLTNYPLFVARMARAMRAERVLVGDVVHGHGLAAAAAPRGVPLVLAPHGLEEFSRADWRKWVAYAPLRLALRRTARRASVVLATDDQLVPAVVTKLGVNRDRVRVVRNGVSLSELDSLVDMGRASALADRLGVAGAPLRLVTCARLEANKGLDLMAKALARHRDALPAGWGWWVVGTGRDGPHLQRLIAAMGLSASIHFLGQLDDQDLHSLLACMDLYVQPSRYEGSSIATLEAMARRLPVLATAVGGLPDKVLPGQTGYLAAPGDSDELGRGLREALADREHWAARGAAGRALVEQRFDWPSIARDLLALYRALLHPRT